MPEEGAPLGLNNPEPGEEGRVPGRVVAPDLVDDGVHGDVVAGLERLHPLVDAQKADERIGLAPHIDRHILTWESSRPAKMCKKLSKCWSKRNLDVDFCALLRLLRF